MINFYPEIPNFPPAFKRCLPPLLPLGTSVIISLNCQMFNKLLLSSKLLMDKQEVYLNTYKKIHVDCNNFFTPSLEGQKVIFMVGLLLKLF